MQFYRRWQPVAAISFDLDDTLYDNGPAIARAEQWMLSHLRSEYLATAMLDKPRWLELKRNLREDDVPGRYGGDEFGVILPGCSLEHASQVMERLRQRVNEYRNEQLPQLRISLSIGLASFQPGFADSMVWLNEADKALYAAKNSGRDKVHFTLGDIVNAP